MEDGDTEKYHASCVIQDFVFLSWKMGCLFVCLFLLLYVPCQQLWSLRDGQLT